MPRSTSSFDIHRKITNQIVEAIRTGAGSGRMPWHRTGLSDLAPGNAVTGALYQGVNILALWASSQLHAYPVGQWASYKQWQSIGAQVRKGQAGTCIIFYKEFPAETQSELDAGEDIRRVARASWVFNASQVDGYKPPEPAYRDPIQRNGSADQLVGDTGADIRHGGDQAYYHPRDDYIQMPDERRFDAEDECLRSEDYYAVLFHELVHWTGAAKRLNRVLEKFFVDATYAKEELVAELGAAFLCAETGISNAPRPEHAAYVENWLKLLENDKQAIFTAASLASKAVRYVQTCWGTDSL